MAAAAVSFRKLTMSVRFHRDNNNKKKDFSRLCSPFWRVAVAHFPTRLAVKKKLVCYAGIRLLLLRARGRDYVSRKMSRSGVAAVPWTPFTTTTTTAETGTRVCFVSNSSPVFLFSLFPRALLFN